MTERLLIDDARSRIAAQCLTRAAQHLAERTEVPALAPETLTAGAGERIGDFMRSVEVARTAIAVAGGSAARLVAASLHSADDLDRSISQALGRGFAIGNEFEGDER